MQEPVRDAALAVSLARLWPNWEHEAPALAGLSCRMHLHFWRRLNLSHLSVNWDVKFCFWCSKIKIDGKVYDP
jgi:hypothetical protein